MHRGKNGWYIPLFLWGTVRWFKVYFDPGIKLGDRDSSLFIRKCTPKTKQTKKVGRCALSLVNNICNRINRYKEISEFYFQISESQNFLD